MSLEASNFDFRNSAMAEILPPEGVLVTDLNELVHTMGRVALAAPEVGLPHLRYGFHGYQRVTAAVTRELTTGVFQDPDKMAMTMPYFAERAFAPMRAHVSGDIEGVGSWGTFYYDKEALHDPAWRAMLRFLEEHIYKDLYQALRDTNTQPYHQDDYSDPINTILANVARELLPQYIEYHPLLQRLKIVDIGLWLAVREIIKARDVAWDAFEESRAADTYYSEDIQSIDATLAATANRPSGVITPRTAEELDHYLSRKTEKGVLLRRKTVGRIIQRVCRTPDHLWT